MLELKMTHSEQDISKMSEDKFRTIVRKSVEKRALSYLNGIALGHSKSEVLVKTKFEREKYFEDSNFSKSESELLFAIRTRTVRNIKKNFPNQNKNNIACQICLLHVDCQQHLLVCSELVQRVKIPQNI